MFRARSSIQRRLIWLTLAINWRRRTESVLTLWSLTLVHKEGGATVQAGDKAITSYKKHQSLQIGNLQKQLQEQKKKNKMLTTKLWKLQQPKKTTRNTIARQNPAVQNLAATCELETVLVLEYANDCKQQAAQWKKEMEMIKQKWTCRNLPLKQL